jgi:hypothetical protein
MLTLMGRLSVTSELLADVQVCPAFVSAWSPMAVAAVLQ